MRRRVSGARVIFVAVSFLFVCLLVGMECAEGRMRRATGSSDCMQEISLFPIFWGSILLAVFSHHKTKRCGFLLSRHGDLGPKLQRLFGGLLISCTINLLDLDFFREMFEVVNQDHLIKLFR